MKLVGIHEMVDESNPHDMSFRIILQDVDHHSLCAKASPYAIWTRCVGDMIERHVKNKILFEAVQK